MSETDHAPHDEEVEHPEVDRAYERDQGGQVPDEEESPREYGGPDPTEDRSGDGDDEDQGI